MPSRVDTMRAIETPEGVDLELRVAGPYERALAYLLDLATRLLVGAMIAILLGLFGGVGRAGTALAFFALEWLYPVLFEVMRGGVTPGKAVLELAVVRSDGRPVGWSQSLLRNTLRGVDILPIGYVAGLLSMFESPSFQRLGDRVAGTLVVHQLSRGRRRNPIKAPPLTPAESLSLAEQAAIVDFASRLGSWSKPRAIEIADNLAPLTGERGEAGVARTLSLANWIGGER